MVRKTPLVSNISLISTSYPGLMYAFFFHIYTEISGKPGCAAIYSSLHVPCHCALLFLRNIEFLEFISFIKIEVMIVLLNTNEGAAYIYMYMYDYTFCIYVVLMTISRHLYSDFIHLITVSYVP